MSIFERLGFHQVCNDFFLALPTRQAIDGKETERKRFLPSTATLIFQLVCLAGEVPDSSADVFPWGAEPRGRPPRGKSPPPIAAPVFLEDVECPLMIEARRAPRGVR